MKKHILIGLVALCGCHPSSDPASPLHATVEAEPAPLPRDNPDDFLKGDLLQVPRQGDYLWNGTPVGADTVKDYLKQVAQRRDDADGAVVEVEPGTPRERAAWVRRQIIDSGLCRQHRCLEARWLEKRPVIN